MSSFKFKRTLAFAVLFTFIGTQIVTPQELQPTSQATLLQPVKDPTVTESAKMEPPQPIGQFPKTTEEFLQDTLTLTPVIDGEVVEVEPLETDAKTEAVVIDGSGYETTSYSFEEALDLIRPEFAAAIPIESMTKEDLETLRNLDVEVLLVGIKGMKFILTSGDQNEIVAYPEINELLREASFLAHTHPDETESRGPSAFDLLAATDQIEHLITPDQIFSYNRDGILERSLSAEALLKRWEEAIQETDADLYEARAWANEFIYQMDRLNEEGEKLKIEALRLAGTVAPTAGLTSANLTSFTGSPWVLLMTGSSPQTTLIQQSSSQFQMNYNVTQSGSRSGAYVSFDNPTTTTVEVRNLSTLTDLIVGVSGPAGSKVKFEVEDSLGVKSDVTLINVSTTMQYYKISKTLFTGLDWTKIKRFIYSIDSTLTTILTGTLAIQTKTLLYSYTAVTNLPNYPYLSILPGSSTNTNLVESGSTAFKLNYDISQAGSISGGSIVLDNPATTTVEVGNLSTQTQFTFGLSGPTNGKVKLEVEDSLGIKSSVTLTGINSSTQYYTVDKNRFIGLNWTSIKRINFIVDSTLGNPLTGTITIQASTLTFSTTVLTNLPNYPYLALVPGASTATTLVETSSTQFKLNYNISQTGSISGGSIVLDNPSTTAIEYGNLSTPTQFTFGLSGPTNGKIKLEFEDSLGVKSSVILTGMSSLIQYYTVSKTTFTGLDWTKIRRINFIVDSTLGNPITGTITIQAKTLTFSSTLLTNLPAMPRVDMMGGSTLGTVVRMTSNSGFYLNFSLSGTGTKSGAQINFDNPSTTSVIETQNLSSHTQFVFIAQGISNGKVRVEMEDLAGLKASTILTGLSTVTQYFVINANLFSGIDRTKVRRITFSVDPTLTTLTSGALWIGARTLLYGTTAAATLPGTPAPFVLEGSTATTYLTEPASTGVRLNYDVSPLTTSFSGGVFSFDDLATQAVETRDLSQGNTLTFGLQSGNSYLTKMKIEIEDLNGVKAATTLTSMTTATQYYTVQKSLFSGIDWTKVKRIKFIVDRTMVTSSTYYKSWAQITLNGFLFNPTVVYNSSLTSANLTILPSGPSLFLLPASSSATSLTPLTDKFDLHYDATAQGSFSGARISYDKPSTSAIETGNLSTFTSLVFGLQAPSNTVRLELVDLNGVKSSVLLTNVQTTEKFYSISTSSFTGIDKTKIKWIQFTIDPVLTNHTLKTGDLFVSTKGLVAPSLSVPVVNPVTSPTNQTTQTLSGTKGAGSGIAINGVMVLPPTDSTTWQAEASLTLEGNNRLQVQETNGGGVLGPITGVNIVRDTTGPTVTLISSPTSNASNYMFIYSVDGVQTQEQITLEEGKNFIVRSASDTLGNKTTKTFQITLESGPPVIQSFQINQGSSMTKTANVKLNLIAYDLGSQVSEMSFSNDGINYSAPEAFAMTKDWTLLEGRGDKTVWVKVKDVNGFWSDPVSATIFYQKVLMLDDFDGTSQVETYWDSNGNLPYQRTIVSSGAFEGTNAMQIDFQKTSALSYAYFALQPKQDGIANDFSTYRTLRVQLNKLHLTPMVLMVKLEFNGTSEIFETQVAIPQGTYGWQESIFDFSTVSVDKLKSVKNILFFADPGNPTAQGSFLMDNIRLDIWPETKVVDDFEGNNIPVQTYWDGNGSLIYQRSITEINAYDGTHSMKVSFTKKPGYPYSFFAWTPKQDGVNNNFTNYGSLRFHLNKISDSPMVIMMKLEFNGTTQTYEKQLYLPKGSNKWEEAIFDFSDAPVNLLSNVKNVLFFVDPASESNTGSFYMDRMRLAEKPIERLMDDFEGNSSLIQTYWDGDGSGTVYTRAVVNLQGFDGTHSMKIDYNKSAQYPTSFFALTPKQDGIANDFSRYNELRLMVKKDSLPAMKLMMKFELDGTQINYESWKEIPQGQTGWIELRYDFSSLDPNILKKVKQVLFFVDPMFYTTPQPTQGTFYIDSIKLGFDSDLPAKQFDPTKPPQMGWVSSSVASDIDNEYHVGSLVRLNAWELNAAGDLLDGTVRIVSKSTGYDSGEQKLIFTHDGQFWPFHWNTTGLKVADDYGVIVTLRDKSGQVTVVGSDTNPALTIKLTKGVPAGGELLRIQDFSLPLIGGNLGISRSYDPTDAEVFDHQLGLGWHSSLDYFVQDFTDGTASVSLGADGYQFYFKNPDGSYRSMAPNNYATLTRLSHGFQMRLEDGTIYEYSSSPFLDFNTKLTTTWFITKIVDRNGNETQFFYDENRNLTKVQAASGDFIQLQYSFRTRDQFNTDKYNLDKIIDQAGNVWTFSHDSKGNLISTTDPLGAKTIYEYDLKSRLTKVIYPDTSTQSYTYDSEGRILQVLRNGVVQSESIFGDRNDSSFKVKDALGRISTYLLSDEGLLLESTDPSGAKTQFTYDSKRNLIKKVDAQGNVYTYTYDAMGNLLTSTDPLGSVTTYTYEPNYNKVTSVKDALGNVAQLVYDSKGNLIRTIDPALNAIENTYDLKGNLIQTKDPLGNVTSFSYDLRGLPLTKTDALAKTTSYQYDSKGNLIKVTNPLGGVAQSTYNALGQVLTQTDPLGRVVTYTYDSMGRAIQVRDPLGNVKTNQYDLNGQLISETDALGGRTLYTYDAKGNLISQTDPLGNVTTFTYDSLDRLIQAKDPLSRTVSYTYDSLGQKISQTDQLGNVVQFQYDVLGRLTKTTFPNGATQTATHDSLGRVLTKTDVLGNVTRFAYDSRGNVISQTDALGSVTTFTYDANNRSTSARDVLGNTTTFSYDALGRMIKTTYADGAIETRTYDALNRVTKVTDALGRNVQSAYDAVGNVIQVTDPVGNISQIQYNALNRKTKEIDPLGNATNYTYDALSRLTKIVDAKGNTSTMAYDLLGRLLSRAYPDSSSESFTYNVVGNVIQSKDRMGRAIQLSYDAGNRLLEKLFPDSSKETFTYDVMGNVLTEVNSTGTIQNQYDLLGRLTKQTDVFGNVLTYTYDAIGNRKSLTATIGASILSRAYTYDVLGRLTQIQDEKGRKTTYTYDSRSRVIEKLLSNGTKTQFTYDLASELTQIAHKNPSGTAFRTLQNTYDTRGLITQKNDSFEGTTSFNYDKLGQLISMTHPVIGLVTFAIDQVGNRTQVTTAGSPQNYSTNSLNEYTQVGTEVLQYDLDGNLISRRDTLTNLTTTYNYDFNNRLIKVTNPDGTVITFTYDTLGRRLTKTVGSTTTRFLWDGAELLAELNSSNQLFKSYVHGPEVDEVLYQEDYVKGVTLFFHQDHLMSTMALSDSSGQVKESYTYDPYGKLVAAKDGSGNTVLPSTRILYTGREFDFETNLYYNRARYYDPSLGRFISADPKGYAAGLNLYTYVRNNPLSFRDPDGLDVYWAEGQIVNGVKKLNGMKWVMANGVWNCVENCPWHPKGESKKGGKRGGLLGVLGIILGIVTAFVAAPLVAAVAGAIGGAIGGAVGGVVGAVAGAVVGSGVAAATTAIVGAAAFAAGSAVVATATSNLVQGAPVFRGVGTNAAFAAITAGAFKAVGVIGSGIQQGFQNIASTVGNAGKTFGSGLTQAGDRIQQSVRNNFFRPQGAEYIVGSDNVSWAKPGQPPMSWLEDFVPTIRPLAVVHDPVVGTLAPGTGLWHPANIPTMPPAYVAGAIVSGFNFAQDIIEGFGTVVNS